MQLTRLLLLCLLTACVLLTQMTYTVLIHVKSIPTKPFRTFDGVDTNWITMRTQERIFKIYMFEGTVVCTSICLWLAFLVMHTFKRRIKPQLYAKVTRGLVAIWKNCLQPLTAIMVTVSIYAALVGFDEISLLDNYLTSYMNQLFISMKNRSIAKGECNCIVSVAFPKYALIGYLIAKNH